MKDKSNERAYTLLLKLFIREVYNFNYTKNKELIFFTSIRFTSKRVFVQTTDLNVDYSIGEFLMIFNSITDVKFDTIKADFSNIFLKLLSDSTKKYSIEISELNKENSSIKKELKSLVKNIKKETLPKLPVAPEPRIISEDK
jgi:hypothetical protein